jgi:nucleotide-binding universal stress UspA family protein
MYKKILVPVDGSTTSQRGLAEAVRIAKHCGATLRLLHVVNELVMAPGYPSVTNYTDVIGILREAGKKVLRTSEEERYVAHDRAGEFLGRRIRR